MLLSFPLQNVITTIADIQVTNTHDTPFRYVRTPLPLSDYYRSRPNLTPGVRIDFANLRTHAVTASL